MIGGNEPPVHYSVNHPRACVTSMEEVRQIKRELKYESYSLSKIASMHGISKRSVLRINQGLSYEELNEKYPIRKVPNLNGKLTDAQVKEIVEILMYSYR